MNIVDPAVSGKNSRIESLDFLRGIAAFGVMLFHYTAVTSIQLQESNPLHMVGVYGHLGVVVFFVLSGFVITYAMNQSAYTLNAIGKFLLKRTIRIEIPFLVVILIEVVLIYVSSLTPWRAGMSERLDAYPILLHIGYLNGVMGEPWLIPVFWTLGIEFQFYLAMALLFPLFVHQSWAVRVIPSLGLIALGFVFPVSDILFVHTPFFVAGIITFQLMTRRIGPLEFALLGIVTIASAYMQHGPVSAAIMVFTTVIILFCRIDWKWSGFLGMISYSLYLVHVPFGGRLLVLTQLFVRAEWAKSLLIIVYLAITIVVAWLYYLLVEKPSLKLSGRFSYKAGPGA